MKRRPEGDPVSKVERAFGRFFTEALVGWRVERSGDAALIKAYLPGDIQRWFAYMNGEFVEVPIH